MDGPISGNYGIGTI